MANKWKLLGSAPDKPGIEAVIEQCYCEPKVLSHNGVNGGWMVQGARGTIPNVRVYERGGRFRFEAYGDWQ